jgi:Uma2 family endonuclease
MSIVTHFTADELLLLPMGKGKTYELVLGELREMSPGGWRHGNVISNLHGRLFSFVNQHKLGMMFGAETGFKLTSNPDTVRAPDVAFIATKNIPKQLPDRGFWPGAPDLAVEVVSPGDTSGEVDETIDAWLEAGCQTVWVVNPKRETVTVYLSRTNVDVRTAGDTLNGDPVVPGFSCQVSDLF